MVLLTDSTTRSGAVPGGPGCRGLEASRPGSNNGNCKNRRPGGTSATAPPRLYPLVGRPFAGHATFEQAEERSRGDGFEETREAGQAIDIWL